MTLDWTFVLLLSQLNGLKSTAFICQMKYGEKSRWTCLMLFSNVPMFSFSYLKLTQDEITCFRISETWWKHATPCFRYVYVKVVRFRCIRSNGNARKRHETGNGNTGYPSCFRNGLTCFCHVSVYGFLQFRPV